MGVALSILSRWCTGFSSTKAGFSAQTWTIHAGDINRSQRRGSGRNRWEGGLRVLLAKLCVNVSYPRGTWPKWGTNHQFAKLSQIFFEEHAHGDKMFESLNDVFRVATCKLSLFGLERPPSEWSFSSCVPGHHHARHFKVQDALPTVHCHINPWFLLFDCIALHTPVKPVH